jgi:hypothetical protein
MSIYAKGKRIAEIVKYDTPISEAVVTASFTPNEAYNEIRSVIREYSLTVMDSTISEADKGQKLKTIRDEISQMGITCSEFPKDCVCDLRDYSEEIGPDGFSITIYQ